MTTLTARAPQDLLAAVPVVLGFRPEQSLVMLTFDARRTFHARVDLPAAAAVEAEVPDLAEVLLGACRTHEVGCVAFVIYGDDPVVAGALAEGLVPVFEADGVGVLVVLRAHAGSWWRVPAHPGEEPSGPMPYDDASHPFAAEAVFAGRVTHVSREALRRTLAPVPEERRRAADLLARLPEPELSDVGRVLDIVDECITAGHDPDPDDAARILRCVTRVEVRDATLYAVSRDAAVDHLRVWSELLRRAPDPQVPDVAAVTAFCAWQSGDGALAWCALDRCFEVDPDHRLGTCLAECLTRAVSPDTWWEVVDQTETA
ncbi:MAG: DUF4192 domain-containing protein [Nocardioides sp.]|nr:DUF4192 domain-containing protein [Nocardioides sp.]